VLHISLQRTSLPNQPQVQTFGSHKC